MSCSSWYQYSVACPFASVHEKVTMLFRAVKPSICSSLLRSHSQGSHQAGSLGKHSYFPRTTAQLPHSTAWDATFQRAFPPPLAVSAGQVPYLFAGLQVQRLCIRSRLTVLLTWLLEFERTAKKEGEWSVKQHRLKNVSLLKATFLR